MTIIINRDEKKGLLYVIVFQLTKILMLQKYYPDGHHFPPYSLVVDTYSCSYIPEFGIQGDCWLKRMGGCWDICERCLVNPP